MQRAFFLSCLFLITLLLPSLSIAGSDPIEVVETETGFYYTIKKGDTLWDLSQHFNNSSWLWPELWKENDQISNPHWIFPGERIRLYKKSGEQVISKVEQNIPTPVAPVTPIVPPDEGKRDAPYFLFTSIDSVGFIRKPPVQSLGTVFEVHGQKVLISEGDQIYIRPSDDAAAAALIPGSRHTLFRYRNPTDDRKSSETIGTQHYLLGVVEITAKQQDLAIAKVLKSFRAIEVGDAVMPFAHRHAKIELRPSTPGIDGAIINSEDHTVITGDNMLAFIDKGRADNIEVGQLYSIYGNKKLELKEEGIDEKMLPPVDFGTLFVLHTEETTSTVVITYSENSIESGERFRTPIQ